VHSIQATQRRDGTDSVPLDRVREEGGHDSLLADDGHHQRDRKKCHRSKKARGQYDTSGKRKGISSCEGTGETLLLAPMEVGTHL